MILQLLVELIALQIFEESGFISSLFRFSVVNDGIPVLPLSCFLIEYLQIDCTFLVYFLVVLTNIEYFSDASFF